MHKFGSVFKISVCVCMCSGRDKTSDVRDLRINYLHDIR